MDIIKIISPKQKEVKLLSPEKNSIFALFSDKNTTKTKPSTLSKKPFFSQPYHGTSIQYSTNGNVVGTPIKIRRFCRLPRQHTHLCPVPFKRPQLNPSSQVNCQLLNLL